MKLKLILAYYFVLLNFSCLSFCAGVESKTDQNIYNAIKDQLIISSAPGEPVTINPLSFGTYYFSSRRRVGDSEVPVGTIHVKSHTNFDKDIYSKEVNKNDVDRWGGRKSNYILILKYDFSNPIPGISWELVPKEGFNKQAIDEKQEKEIIAAAASDPLYQNRKKFIEKELNEQHLPVTVLPELILSYFFPSYIEWQSSGRRLISAVKSNNIKVVRELLEDGNLDLDIKEFYYGNRTPLMIAIDNKFIDIAKELLKKGADVNTKNNHGTTLLMLAVSRGFIEIVKELLEKRVDVNAKNDDGMTALRIARLINNIEIAELLKKYGATEVMLQDKIVIGNLLSNANLEIYIAGENIGTVLPGYKLELSRSELKDLYYLGLTVRVFFNRKRGSPVRHPLPYELSKKELLMVNSVIFKYNPDPTPHSVPILEYQPPIYSYDLSLGFRHPLASPL